MHSFASEFGFNENETVALLGAQIIQDFLASGWWERRTSSTIDIGTSGQRSSRSAFGQSTGNDVSGHYKHHSLPFFFLSWPFLVEGVLGSKNLFSKNWRECPKTQGYTSFQTPLAILDWVGGEVLQVVRRCRRLASAPSAARLLFFLLSINIQWA